MNLKKLLGTTAVVMCLSMSMPVIASAMTPVTEGNDPAKTEVAVDPMVRLQEIKDMDKSNLSKTEKKDLRKEVKEIKKVVRANKNGVYLSIGAVVIIALLLILLL